MQDFNDSELEDWHDYEVESPREILALLRAIGEKKQLIRVLIRDGSDVFVSSVLQVDPASDSLILDCPVNQDQLKRILAATRISFETTLDKIRILFAASAMQMATFNDQPALRMALPERMVRLQRREFYRMPTPVSTPVRVLIRLPAQLEPNAVFPLHDISCGGIAVLDHKFLLGKTIGDNYPDCRIELPEIGQVTTTLQIRNVLDLTLLNSKTNRRVGCAFVDISRGNLSSVQRYITKLERERNARIAGLG